MNAERAAPMVHVSCRVPLVVLERIGRLVASSGLPRCELIRRALELGAATLERELNNHGGQAS